MEKGKEKKKKYTLQKYKVGMYDLSGKYIATFESPMAAAASMGFNGHSNIISCCNGERRSAFGCQWRKDPDGTEDIAPVSRGKGHAEGKRVAKYDHDGKFVAAYESITQAAKENKIYPATICRCLSLPYTITGGCYWRVYTGDNGDIVPLEKREKALKTRPVSMYSKSGEYIRSYPSIAAAAKAVRCSHNMIWNCVANYGRTAGGYQWREDNGDHSPIGECVTSGKGHTRGRAVVQYSRDRAVIAVYSSMREAAHAVGLAGALSIKVAADNYPSRSAAGFLWKYANGPPDAQHKK